MGTLAIAGLAFFVFTISGAFFGGSESGQFSIPLLILLGGSLLGALMIAGGRIALVSTSPEMARRGSLAQAVPAVLVAGLLIAYVVVQFVLPSVGSGRYYHDYSSDHDLSVDMRASLENQATLSGATIDAIYIQPGAYESELGYDDSEFYLIDYLCERNGVEARTQGSRADLECSLVAVRFSRGGVSYDGRIPIHNRVDGIVDASTYKAVALRRLAALLELDATYWTKFDEVTYYLNWRDSAPILTQ
ncbi:MAG: hypothetical protein KJ747_01995 [Actinobacteria bacterium]|nr:hypothetical protein [Actinomycetota bacterium]MCG2807635.1 hypothetical protein [Coriobacteriia bacterium]